MKNLFFVIVLTDKCSYIFVEAIFLSIFCWNKFPSKICSFILQFMVPCRKSILFCGDLEEFALLGVHKSNGVRLVKIPKHLKRKRHVELIWSRTIVYTAQKISSVEFKACEKMCYVHKAYFLSRKAQQPSIPHKSAQPAISCTDWCKHFCSCGASCLRLIWIKSQKVSNMDRTFYAIEVLACFVGSIWPGINSFMSFLKFLESLTLVKQKTM